MWNEVPENFVPNDFGGVTVTITSGDLDAPLVIDGLNKISVIPDDPEYTLTKADSGMTTVNRIRTTSGKFVIELSDASTSMGSLSTLARLKKPVGITVTDPVTPDLNASSNYAFFEKHSDIVRSAETNMSEFTLIAPIAKMATGGFTIVTAS